jgi:DNA-binding NtrC family response regulator
MKLRVLILDGDPERGEQIVTLLRLAGHEAVVERAAAGEAIGLSDYDLLLLDPALPTVDLAALGRAIFSAAPMPPDSLHDAERRHLALALRHTSGNKRKAAHLLGISRSTLLNKVRKYGLED